MLSAESFCTHSLSTASEGKAVARILAATIQAVEPGQVLKAALRREGSLLTIQGRTYDLSAFQSVQFLGLGKASVAMAEALVDLIGDQIDGGLVITKHLPAHSAFPFPIIAGGHPVPDQNSLTAGKKVLELVSDLCSQDLLICLISGGGSALVTAPVEGVNWTEIAELTQVLLACGASIDEINLLRRRLDQVKGGGLTRLTNGATILSLILSDVVGNPFEAIASGPTAPDPLNRADALGVLEKYRLKDRIPASVLSRLESGPETPKADDLLFTKVQNVLVGSNLVAAQAALKKADEEGFHPYLLRLDLQGEARTTAFELATFLRQASRTGYPVLPPACMVAGGETTVTLMGTGRGGRNCELALAAVSELADFPRVMLVTLATDGEDGPTDAAGAVVTGLSYRRAAGLGLRVAEALERNDSYTFFEKLDDLLKPGPTGTNVNDLVFMFIF